MCFDASEISFQCHIAVSYQEGNPGFASVGASTKFRPQAPGNPDEETIREHL